MIDEELVKHIARLARLELSANELVKIQRELSLILDYITLLNEVNVDAVEPFCSPVSLHNVTRFDVAAPESDVAQKIKEQFPHKEASYLKVREIL